MLAVPHHGQQLCITYFPESSSRQDNLVAISLQQLTTQGQKLMQYAAYLGADFIPLSLVSELLEEEGPEQVLTVVNHLSQLQLVQVISMEGQEQGLKVYPEVQGCCKQYQDWCHEATLGKPEVILSKLASALVVQMPWVEPVPNKSWQQARLYAPHVVTVVKALKDLEAASSEVVAKLLVFMGQYSQQVERNFFSAIEFFEDALATYHLIFSKINIYNHPLLANIWTNLGTACYASGNAMQAQICFEYALIFYQQIYQEIPHPLIADTWTNLGTACYASGNAMQAQICFEYALIFYQQIYQEIPHPLIADTWTNLGIARYALGDAMRAKTCFKKALTFYKKVYKDKCHPAIALAFNNLGTAYYASGNAMQAQTYFEHALRFCTQIYKNTPHPLLADIWTNLGIASHTSGRAEQAQICCKEALTLYQKICENECHPAIAMAFNNLGAAWYVLGDAKQAQTCFECALEISELIYDLDHPYRGLTCRNLQETLNALGKIKRH